MKTIQLPHKVTDYACMINGLEDLYESKTGVRLPGYFLMDMSSIGFTYIKQMRAPAPRSIFWGNGMGRQQYEFLEDVIGFKTAWSEGTSFKRAWQSVLNNLQQGTPVEVGVLDMYHLPYFEKFYHRYHIPQHFILLVGYDEQRACALAQDNSLPGIQCVPLSDLRLAWDVRIPGQARPNSLYTFQFGARIAGLEEIARLGLQKSAQRFLNAPRGFLGLRGMLRAQAEIARWERELTPAQWTESLRALATFTCSVVPNLPQKLLPYPLGYTDPHQAVRDRFAAELSELAGRFGRPAWGQAAELFGRSGALIGQLTEIAVAALGGEAGAMSGAADLLARVARLEEDAFRLLA